MQSTLEPHATADSTPAVRPLRDRVLVRRIESPTTTGFGIHIPDAAQEPPLEGIVVAVGNGRVLDDGSRLPVDVQVGDKVLFGKWSGTEIEIGNEKLVIMREDEVMAVVS